MLFNKAQGSLGEKIYPVQIPADGHVYRYYTSGDRPVVNLEPGEVALIFIIPVSYLDAEDPSHISAGCRIIVHFDEKKEENLIAKGVYDACLSLPAEGNNLNMLIIVNQASKSVINSIKKALASEACLSRLTNRHWEEQFQFGKPSEHKEKFKMQLADWSIIEQPSFEVSSIPSSKSYIKPYLPMNSIKQSPKTGVVETYLSKFFGFSNKQLSHTKIPSGKPERSPYASSSSNSTLKTK